MEDHKVAACALASQREPTSNPPIYVPNRSSFSSRAGGAIVAPIAVQPLVSVFRTFRTSKTLAGEQLPALDNSDRLAQEVTLRQGGRVESRGLLNFSESGWYI